MNVFTSFLATYGSNGDTNVASRGANVVLIVVGIVFVVALLALAITAMWNVFAKAGKPGWACIVPFYNWCVLAEIAGKPSWWGLYPLLSLIPFIGWIGSLVVSLIIAINVARNFGKSDAFGVVGLWLFGVIGYPILGFGDAQYHPVPSDSDDHSGMPGVES